MGEMEPKLHSKLFSSLKLENFRGRRTHEMEISRNVIKYLFSFRLDPSFFHSLDDLECVPHSQELCRETENFFVLFFLFFEKIQKENFNWFLCFVCAFKFIQEVGNSLSELGHQEEMIKSENYSGMKFTEGNYYFLPYLIRKKTS